MADLSKENIINLLLRQDPPEMARDQRLGMHAIGRALLVLSSVEPGFAGNDRPAGLYMAAFYQKNGFLTERQIAWWRQPDRKNVPRICKYWRQLLEEAQRIKANPGLRRLTFLPKQIDLLESDEEVMDRLEAVENQRMIRRKQAQLKRSDYFKWRTLHNRSA